MIKKSLILAIFWLFSASLALAQVSNNSQSGAGSIAPSPSSTPVAVANMVPVSILNYGAVCDGTTNDGPAISAAIQGVAANVGTNVGYRLNGCAGKTVKITSAINASGINARGAGLLIDFAGMFIDCQVSGGICLDRSGSTNTIFSHYYIHGNASVNTPKIGLQLARLQPNASFYSASNHDSDCIISGAFTLAPLYELAAEENTFNGCHIQNSYATGVPYGAVFDNYNHWNASSTFQTITWTPDTPFFQNDVKLHDCEIQNDGGAGPAIWMGGILGAHIDCYIEAGTYTGADVVIYSEGTNSLYLATNINFSNSHIETGSQTSTFQFDGTATSPTIAGLTYHDHTSLVTTSIFSTAGSVTSVSLPDLDLRIDGFTGTPKVFDTATKYTVKGGRIIVPSIANWTFPPTAQFNANFWAPDWDAPGQGSRAPYVIAETHIPFILPSSGSIGNNGALTITTALATTYASAYISVPAGAIATGVPAAQAWYYATCSSTTVCTLFNNVYTAGTATIPASPTAFVTTGPGAYTQTSGSSIVGLNYTLAANQLGTNGGVRISGLWINNSSAGVKTVAGTLTGAWGFAFDAQTTNTMNPLISGFSNRGVANSQVQLISNNFKSASAVSALTYGAVDTTAAKAVQIGQKIATATDWLVMENVVMEVIP